MTRQTIIHRGYTGDLAPGDHRKTEAVRYRSESAPWPEEPSESSPRPEGDEQSLGSVDSWGMQKHASGVPQTTFDDDDDEEDDTSLDGGQSLSLNSLGLGPMSSLGEQNSVISALSAHSPLHLDGPLSPSRGAAGEDEWIDDESIDDATIQTYSKAAGEQYFPDPDISGQPIQVSQSERASGRAGERSEGGQGTGRGKES
jgi:hypothetical protein